MERNVRKVIPVLIGLLGYALLAALFMLALVRAAAGWDEEYISSHE